MTDPALQRAFAEDVVFLQLVVGDVVLIELLCFLLIPIILKKSCFSQL
jgi:hypothetical protein